MKKIITIGESMALLASNAAGPLRFAKSLELGFGGAEGNVAIALARQGTDVTWVSRVGDDEFGRLITSTMRGEGVDVRARVDEQRRTGLMVRETKRFDLLAVTYYRAESAASALSELDLSEIDFASFDILHTTGITSAISQSSRIMVRSALAAAKAAGVKTTFDINYRAALWSKAEAAEEIRALLPNVDVLFGGLDELQIIAGDQTQDYVGLAANLRNQFDLDVVVKLGAEGAFALTSDGAEFAPAFSIKLASPVGAGDAFVAGYLAGEVENQPLNQKLIRANATGAWVASGFGDWESAPTKAELFKLTESDVAR